MAESEQEGVGQARPMRAVAFQLAQLGAHASQRFTERIAEIGLTPPEVGILRMIAAEPGRSQRALAAELGVVPSRVVALIDPLDRKGLIERRRSVTDRRNHELHLTPAAREALARVAKVAVAHETELTAELSDAEYRQFADLLARLAAARDLSPGVHPGYRMLGANSPS